MMATVLMSGIANAQPNKAPQKFNNRPVQNTRPMKPSKPIIVNNYKKHNDGALIAGTIMGLAGFVIGSNYNSQGTYYQNTSYNNIPYQEPNCTTVYDRYSGTTTTTCKAQPQYSNTIIIQ